MIVDMPVDSIALYGRAGAVIPKIPEDVMTLVPQSESGNRSVKAMDDRRIYELLDGPGGAAITDFEGRKVERGANSLNITGDSAAHIIVRWRAGPPSRVTVNGAAVKVNTGDGGVAFVEFDHSKESMLAWQ